MGDVEAFRAIVADVADVGHAQRVTIGPDVWIGASAAIMPGITIGTGAIIGAAAVVTHDVAPYSVVVGAPARHLRFRLRDGLLERVLASEWWLWDLRGIPGHRDYRDPAAFLERFLAARDSGLLERLRPAVVTVRDRTLHGIVADGEGNVPDPVSMII
ncbi:MAG: hypothetical protein HIU82_02080 [Proteobacteria bacterium]|nr:hypothetical protein [Pseudomonadota bacterium]